ncbi:hypothetical protein DL768_005716 [Monosporascus sp. mg162]|nr:hypothetical protein DL768_005716 [Monosporascus sp. mg162]
MGFTMSSSAFLSLAGPAPFDETVRLGRHAGPVTNAAFQQKIDEGSATYPQLRMAEAFGVAASALAVTEISAKVISLCLQYSRDVKHAKGDIERVNEGVANWKTVVEELQVLLDSPHGIRLQTSQKLRDALTGGRSQLGSLHDKLTPSTRRQAMKQFGFRALKWPFESTEVEKILQDLARCMQPVTTALQIDQTAAVLTIDKNLVNVDQKIVFDKLPTAEGAAFDSHADEHSPTCLPDTRVDLLHEINEWVEDPVAKAVFWLNGMAGTGKSTISRTLARSFSERGQLGASFFFKRGEGDRGGASKFFTTIAAQLVRREPAFEIPVKTAIDADPAICQKPLREQFEKLILEPLSTISPSVRKANVLILVEMAIPLFIFAATACRFLADRRNGTPDTKLRKILEQKTRSQKSKLDATPKAALSCPTSSMMLYALFLRTFHYYKQHLSKYMPQLLVDMHWSNCLQTLEGHTNWVTSVTFSSNGKVVASGSYDQTVRLWSANTGALQQTLEGHNNKVTSVAFSPDGTVVVSGSGDQTVRLWSIDTGALQQIFEGHGRRVHSVAFSPDGTVVASGSGDQTIRLWSADTGTLQQTLEGHNDGVHSVAFSPDGTVVASGSGDQTVRLWSTDTGVLQQIFEGHDSLVYSVAFSPDGTVVASGWSDRTVRLWSADTDALQQTFKGHNGEVTSVTFSPDGTVVASGSDDQTVRLWSADTGTLRRTLGGHNDGVTSVAFSPDGTVVASGSEDNTVRLWSADTGALQQTLEGHNKGVISVAFSHDGKVVASGSDDQTVRLWSTDTGALQQIFEGHDGWVHSVAFSPDGTVVASRWSDRT